MVAVEAHDGGNVQIARSADAGSTSTLIAGTELLTAGGALIAFLAAFFFRFSARSLLRSSFRSRFSLFCSWNCASFAAPAPRPTSYEQATMP